jgi:hypothetical protein
MMTEQWKLKWATVKQIKAAAEELKEIIRARYPEAQFRLDRAPDDQHIWFLRTFVDVDDPDEVRALTEERENALLMQQHMLLHVSPRHSSEMRSFGYRPVPARKTG